VRPPLIVHILETCDPFGSEPSEKRAEGYDFFELLEGSASSQAGEAVSIDQFIDVAEACCGAHLRGLFDAWLFQPSKPVADPVVEAIAGD
jgi:hypothetical protein